MSEPANVKYKRGIVQCTYCGAINPKMTCSRCKSAHYCGVDCQKVDWPVHKHNCNKSSSTLTIRCGHCGKRDPMMKCGKCLRVHYCDTECQLNEWETHKLECKSVVTNEDQVELSTFHKRACDLIQYISSSDELQDDIKQRLKKDKSTCVIIETPFESVDDIKIHTLDVALYCTMRRVDEKFILKQIKDKIPVTIVEKIDIDTKLSGPTFYLMKDESN